MGHLAQANWTERGAHPDAGHTARPGSIRPGVTICFPLPSSKSAAFRIKPKASFVCLCASAIQAAVASCCTSTLSKGFFKMRRRSAVPSVCWISSQEWSE